MVSIQQASANAFAAWLQGVMPDVTVLSRWPNGPKLPPKAITVVPAGARRDTVVDARLLTKANVGALQTQAVWQIAMCRQPFQLDVWCQQHAQRDDIIARLDPLLRAGANALPGAYNPSPIGLDSGVLIQVGDGWVDTIADFDFGAPNVDDSGDEVALDQFRASYSGDARVMLTVATTTARQKLINFQLRLSDDEAQPTTYPVT